MFLAEKLIKEFEDDRNRKEWRDILDSLSRVSDIYGGAKTVPMYKGEPVIGTYNFDPDGNLTFTPEDSTTPIRATATIPSVSTTVYNPYEGYWDSVMKATVQYDGTEKGTDEVKVAWATIPETIKG